MSKRLRRQRTRGQQILARVLISMLMLCLAVGMGGGLWWQDRLNARPSGDIAERVIAEGVSYARYTLLGPTPVMIHVVQVNLMDPAIRVITTRPDPLSPRAHAGLRTSDFLSGYGAVAAINGSFFEPFWSESPWDYYPKEGDPVDIFGIGISEGRLYATNTVPWPVFSVDASRAWIRRDGPVAGARCALSGQTMLVENGEAVVTKAGGARQPRTAVALDAKGTTLYLVVVDGRQKGYSEGLTLFGFADLLAGMDIDCALNMDGGGSSTMVVTDGGEARVMNAPFHTRIPMRERPVATHIGIRRNQGAPATANRSR